MKTNPHPFPLIAIEGIDGCGKTTLIEGLKKWDKKNKIGAIFTKEPTNGPFGQKIRKILNNHGCDENGRRLEPHEFQELYIYDRVEHREAESVFLGEYPLVSDRDFVSTVVYGEAGGVSPRLLLEKHESILGKLFFVPDLVVILDLRVEEAMKRNKKAGKTEDDFAKLAFQKKVSEAYLGFPQIMKRFYPDVEMAILIINASKSPEEVLEQTIDIIRFYGNCRSCDENCQFRKTLS